jgi:hypothetical protein
VVRIVGYIFLRIYWRISRTPTASLNNRCKCVVGEPSCFCPPNDGRDEGWMHPNLCCGTPASTVGLDRVDNGLVARKKHPSNQASISEDNVRLHVFVISVITCWIKRDVHSWFLIRYRLDEVGGYLLFVIASLIHYARTVLCTSGLYLTGAGFWGGRLIGRRSEPTDRTWRHAAHDIGKCRVTQYIREEIYG